jgi:hypothetical protein
VTQNPSRSFSISPQRKIQQSRQPDCSSGGNDYYVNDTL